MGNFKLIARDKPLTLIDSIIYFAIHSYDEWRIGAFDIILFVMMMSFVEITEIIYLASATPFAWPFMACSLLHYAVTHIIVA